MDLPREQTGGGAVVEGAGDGLTAMEYAAIQPRVERALRRRFPSLDADSRADAIQTAWEKLIAKRRAGEPPESPTGWLITVAGNEVLETFRRREDAIEPTAAVFDELAIEGPEAEPTALSEAQLAAILSRLGRDERRVLALNVLEGYKADEVRRRLRMTAKRYELVRARGLRQVVSLLPEYLPDEYGEACGRLQQLLAEGAANIHQLRLAKRIAVDGDAEMAHVLATTGHTLHALGTLPAAALLAERGGSLASELAFVAEQARERAQEIAARLNPFSSSPAGEQGSEAAAGTVAGGGAAAGGGAMGLLGSSLAGKAVVACLATGSVAATCAVTGVLPWGDRDARGPEPAEAAREREDRPRILGSDEVIEPAAVQAAELSATAARRERRAEQRAEARREQQSTEAAPAPEPTVVGETPIATADQSEFGLAPTPAPAPPPAEQESSQTEFGP